MLRLFFNSSEADLDVMLIQRDVLKEVISAQNCGQAQQKRAIFFISSS